MISLGKSILLPAFTVAEWGGLHENVLAGAQALKLAGHEVTLVLRPGTISERARDRGLAVIEVDWEDWMPTASLIREHVEYDLILAQPQKSRELALFVNSHREKPVFVMFHGYYSDGAYEWRDKVEAFLAVTTSLADFLINFCKVEPWRVHVVPNGITSDRFALLPIPLAQKIKDGTATIVVASRIDADKRSQIEALLRLIERIKEVESPLRWRIVVVGDGPERTLAEVSLNTAVTETDNISVEFTGWKDSDEVPLLMQEAVFTVGAGRGALQSLAVGTPCLGAGKHGIVGFQFGRNLRIGLWSNFGDYPFGKAPIRSLEDDFDFLLNEDNYRSVQHAGRTVVESERSQDVSDALLFSALSM
ncbi:glycosyltransferase family 4 protein [Arthrobacter sp. JSM 101049]|uniref:glycosyltransferase family 4 protein n=1 Tax=Arthrobacter sp. JSM 101049 TaxID=929097 RepID=UPI003564F27C